MAKKRDSKPEQRKPESKSVSRRNFLTHGAVAGVSAAALGGSVGETSAQGTAVDGIKWDYEADVVVIGSGASGLPCAIRARDAGLRVLVDRPELRRRRQDAAQRRPGLARRRRPVPAAGHRRRSATRRDSSRSPRCTSRRTCTEDADFLFRDITDWSVLDVGGARPVPLQRTRACIAPGPTTATAPGNS